MEPKDIAVLVIFAPVAAIWICIALWFCAVALRMAWDSLRGEL